MQTFRSNAHSNFPNSPKRPKAPGRFRSQSSKRLITEPSPGKYRLVDVPHSESLAFLSAHTNSWLLFQFSFKMVTNKKVPQTISPPVCRTLWKSRSTLRRWPIQGSRSTFVSARCLPNFDFASRCCFGRRKWNRTISTGASSSKKWAKMVCVFCREKLFAMWILHWESTLRISTEKPVKGSSFAQRTPIGEVSVA